MSDVDVIKPEVITLDEKDAYILEQYLQKTPVKEIAKALGITERSVYNRLAKPTVKCHINKTKEVLVDELRVIAYTKLEEMMLSDNVYSVQWAVNTYMKMESDVEKLKAMEKIGEKNFTTLEQLMGSLDK